MKILMVTHHFFPCVGGMEKIVLDLSQRLIQRRHQCDVVCLNKCAKSNKVLSSEAEFKGIKIYRIPFTDFGIYKIAPKVLDFVKN